MQEGFIDIEGKKIWYSVYGKELKKTPVLVVHGGPGFLSMPMWSLNLGNNSRFIFRSAWQRKI